VFLVFLCNVGLIYSVSKHKDYFFIFAFRSKNKVLCFRDVFVFFFWNLKFLFLVLMQCRLDL